MTKRKVIVNAMGKQIHIDNPNSIEISLKDKGCKPFKFELRIDKQGTRKLARAYKKIGRGRR